MVNFLYLTAELTNVTELKPTDSKDHPYEYTFQIQCTSCRETHDKEISINLYEKHEIQGSKGEASFVGACSFCGTHSNIDIKLPKNYNGYTVEQNGKKVKMLEIESRGFEIVKFIPDGPFTCKGTNSTTVFREVDLSDNEWYDYDDAAAEETNITDIKWENLKK